MIRNATIDDLPRIQIMARAFAEVSGIGVPYDEDSCESTALMLMESPTGCLQIGEGGMVGGLIYPHFFNADYLMAQELFWYVDPEKRGTGIGSALFKSFEGWAERMGAKHVSMIALASQKPVGRLYERKGYRPMESMYVRAL